jgi:hypothetical protein
LQVADRNEIRDMVGLEVVQEENNNPAITE